MINRIRKRLFSTAETAKRLHEICDRLYAIREQSNMVALYGSPTEGHWLGIANATKGLYDGAALEIPQSYSNPIFSEAQIHTVCEKIKELEFEKVIISGFALYFFDFIDRLYGSCEVQALFHGTISEFHNPVIQKQVHLLIQYSRENKIKELLFVKDGLELVFTQLYKIKASHLPLNTPYIPANLPLIKTDPTKIHIGVFGGDTFNKNLHNQVIYALLNENTIVHVLDKGMFEYLGMGDRIVGHGNNLPKEIFLGIIGAMTVNLYMSYSESWGLVAYESEAMGVPVVRMDDIDYYEKIRKAIGSKKK